MRRKNKDMNRIDGLSLNLERNNIEKINMPVKQTVDGMCDKYVVFKS